jgi:hypothetical protein
MMVGVAGAGGVNVGIAKPVCEMKKDAMSYDQIYHVIISRK